MKPRGLIEKLLLLPVFFFACISSAESDNCVNDDRASCRATERKKDDCLDPPDFLKLVSSYYEDESVLSSLRGTVPAVISQTDASALLNSLPDFVEASGYDENSNGRAYAAPQGYAALGLKELKPYPKAYNNLIKIREQVRSTTEKSLNLCPGSLFVDFTTISQKSEGGAHRPHADNCIHYFEDGVALCDASRVHPYPKRVAASILYLNDPISGNYEGGQFYFANRTNNGDVEDGGAVDISTGNMVYFTSGVENLHGALPVTKREGGVEPKRLALAMWYVFDQSLMESLEDADPNAPTEIFSLTLPNDVDMDGLLLSMGRYLVSRQNTPMIGSWTVSKYESSTLHVLFKDHSAMFAIKFIQSPSRVIVERHTDTNKRASLQYMLQESVMLHGVLDEFPRIMSNNELIERQMDAFNQGLKDARSKLPARQA